MKLVYENHYCIQVSAIYLTIHEYVDTCDMFPRVFRVYPDFRLLFPNLPLEWPAIDCIRCLKPASGNSKLQLAAVPFVAYQSTRSMTATYSDHEPGRGCPLLVSREAPNKHSLYVRPSVGSTVSPWWYDYFVSSMNLPDLNPPRTPIVMPS